MLRILLVYDDFQELTTVEMMLKKIGFDVIGITSEFALSDQLLSFNPHIVVAQGQSSKVSSAGVGKRLRESLRWDGKSVLIFYPIAKPHPTDLLKMRMDVGLEYPVEPSKIVQVLSQLGGLDTDQLIDKMKKTTMPQESNSSGAAPPQGSNQEKGKSSIFISKGKKDDGSVTTFQGEKPSDNPLFPLDTTPANIGDPVMQELENLLKGEKAPAKPAPQPLINDPLRAERYSKVLESTPQTGLSAIARREAKSRLRDMVKDMSQESLRNQDDKRREFVKALFKKKG